MALDISEIETEDESAFSLSLLLLVAAVAGILVGFVGGSFRWCLDELQVILLHALDWLHAADRANGTPGWLWAAAAAALSVGLSRTLVRFAPAAVGSGIQHVEAVMHGEAAPAPFRTLPVKFIGGLLAIGPGLALGREGPTVQMAAIIGAQCGRFARMSKADHFLLYTAVAGAGLSVAFNAPLAGCAFAIEEVAKRVTLRRLLVTLTAVATSVAVFRAHFGDATDFTITLSQDIDVTRILLMSLLGALCGLLGAAYNRSVVFGLNIFARLPNIPPELKAAIGGAVVGLIAWSHPEWIGSGETHIQTLFNGHFTAQTLVALLIARWFLGVLCYSLGVPGGLFAPMLLVGTILGALWSLGLESLSGIQFDNTAFAMVGMAAFFTGVVRAPFTGILLAVEMSGNIVLMIPLILSSVVASAFATAIHDPPIYDTLRDRMMKTSAHK